MFTINFSVTMPISSDVASFVIISGNSSAFTINFSVVLPISSKSKIVQQTIIIFKNLIVNYLLGFSRVNLHKVKRTGIAGQTPSLVFI